jgi:hypothetical protein
MRTDPTAGAREARQLLDDVLETPGIPREVHYGVKTATRLVDAGKHHDAADALEAALRHGTGTRRPRDLPPGATEALNRARRLLETARDR